MIVLDASAAVELLLGTPRGAQLASRIGSEALHAPHLIDLEVTSVLRTLAAKRAISGTDAASALTDWLALPVVRYAHDPLVPRIWELRANLTAYDAAYVALAEHLATCLITCDAKLASAPTLPVQVELFE